MQWHRFFVVWVSYYITINLKYLTKKIKVYINIILKHAFVHCICILMEAEMYIFPVQNKWGRVNLLNFFNDYATA